MGQVNVSEQRPLDRAPWRMVAAGFLVLGLGVSAGFACRAVKDGWMLVAGVSLFTAGLIFGLAFIYKGLTWLVFFRLKGAPVFSVHPGGIHILGGTPRLLPWSGIRSAEVREGTETSWLVVTLEDDTTCTVDLGACAIDRERLRRELTRLAAVPTSVDRWLVCPACGFPSDSLKTYTIFVFLFLFVMGSAQRTRGIGCPKCMRRQTTEFLRVNFLAANVCWPFVVLPWGIWLMARSLVHGHSREVLDTIRDAGSDKR